MRGFVASQIARIDRNLALVALALALTAAATGWYGWADISAALLGPQAVTAEEIASARFQSDPNFYKTVFVVQGSELSPVFYTARVPQGKRTATLYCWFLKVGEKHILVEDWAPPASLTAAGRWGTLPPKVYHSALSRRPADEILPLMLDERDWKKQGWAQFCLGGGVGIAALIVAGVLIRWKADPEKHPVRRAIARLGDFEAIAMQIDGEMQGEMERFGAVHLGQTILIYAPRFSFDAVRIENITGAQTRWVQQGKSRVLCLALDTRDGRAIRWQIDRRYADALLTRVCAGAHIEPSTPEPPKPIELRIGG